MSYTAPQYTLAAGERLPIPGEGKFVRVIEATDAFEIALDNGSMFFIEQGIAVESPGFKKVVIRNPQAVPITVRLGISNGVIHDSRFSVPGTLAVQVDNFPAPLDAYERMGYLKPGANSGRYVVNTELVSAAANLNGVIVRSCVALAWVNSFVGVGTGSGYEYFIFGAVNASQNIARPIFFPAGTALWALAEASSAVTVTWDVL